MRTEADTRALLERGEMRVRRLLSGASNFTFLAEVTDGGRGLPVVYKPRAGETPLWDFPDGTLSNREVGASVVADALGWPNVPPTVLRDGPHGPGSVQLFVRTDPGEHYFTLRERYPDVFRAVAAFDAVAGNGDRKGGHCLLGSDGMVWVVDHGLCFNTRPVLRTVIWDFAGEPVPAGLVADLRRVERELRGGSLRAALVPLLDAAEVDATADRAGDLARAGVFPSPGPGRSVPWPPV
jgi:uncharacterized repeat protein (TIGR03843 family)